MWWMVVFDGKPLRRWMTRQEADSMAERWQGSHGGYRGGSGLLKLKDRGDWIEVKPDKDADREWEGRLKVMKAGERQTVSFMQTVQEGESPDPFLRR